MYKAVKSKGRVVEMARQDEKTLLYWVAGNVKKRRLQDQGTDGQISSVNNRNGYGESGKKNWQKLFCYCMGKEEIEISDIEAICTTQITNKNF